MSEQLIFGNFIKILHSNILGPASECENFKRSSTENEQKIRMSKNKITHISKIDHKILFKADPSILTKMGSLPHIVAWIIIVFSYTFWIGDYKLYTLHRNNHNNAYSNNDERIIYLQNNWFVWRNSLCIQKLSNLNLISVELVSFLFSRINI